MNYILATLHGIAIAMNIEQLLIGNLTNLTGWKLRRRVSMQIKLEKEVESCRYRMG